MKVILHVFLLVLVLYSGTGETSNESKYGSQKLMINAEQHKAEEKNVRSSHIGESLESSNESDLNSKSSESDEFRVMFDRESLESSNESDLNSKSSESEEYREIFDTPVCKKNEIYSDCCNRGCIAYNCTQLGYPLSCTDTDKKYCKKGCICQEGYLRAKNGTCVPKSKCDSPCGGDPNSRPGCGINRGRLCSNYDSSKPIPCPKICRTNACDCKDGFVLDTNVGKCVLPKQCSPTCKRNEIYNSCTNSGCVPQNCSQLGYPVPCVRIDPRYCLKGCTCKEGYLRAKNGTCVPKDKCGTPCGGDPNAVPGCGTNCGKHCSNIGQGPVACKQLCNLNGCDCMPGFVLDDNTNKCVRPNQCSPTCKENEVYNSCTNSGCVPQNCSQLGYPVPCVRIDPRYCLKGCTCKEGYLRAKNGTCVPKDKCGTPCGGDPNAVPGCGSNCGKYCSNIGQEPVACKQLCNLNGCDCKPGYVLDDKTNKCVRPNQCSIVCKPNEVYSSCVNGGCDRRNCSELNQPKTCRDILSRDCITGCVCQPGFLRNDDGDCVPENQCPVIPTKCKKNEVLDDCVNGGCSARNCSQLGHPVPCVKLDPKSCRKGCVCEKGYLRASYGTCILKENCDVIPTKCKKNEVLDDCVNGGCSARNCSQLGHPVPCVKLDPKSCRKGCVCREGYLKARNGTCVLKENCGACRSDPNAVSGCGGHCGNLCSNYNSKKPIVCPLICDPNGCDCKKGYVFDSNRKKCVLPERCSVMMRDVKRCPCNPGFIRNIRGECILEANCPQTCKANEVYSTCVNGGCDRRNCSQLTQPSICIDPLPSACIKGCVCKPGYLRNKTGICIPENQCLERSCPANEIFNTCAPSSDPVCISGKIVTNGKPSITLCFERCTCKLGFIRNINGECISEANCRICKGPKEYYSCGRACDNICATLSSQNQTNCPIINIKCNEMCYCEKGYARDKNNVCIPISDCPGSTPNCGKNEEYNSCANVLCRFQNCSEIGRPLQCPGIVERSCRGKCVCKENYLRDKYNNCIPKAHCNVCPDNEFYSNCPAKPCDAEYCPRSRNDHQACISTKECTEPRCVCNFNHKRDRKSGKCIPISSCPPFPCGKNEVFDSCAPVCPGQNCSDYLNNSTCPKFKIGIVVSCHPQCRCKEGYYRNLDGICIAKEKCSTAICGKNEQYSTCKNLLCGGQNCSTEGKRFHCPLVTKENCQSGCICKDNFLRNNGVCIPAHQCPGKHITKPKCKNGDNSVDDENSNRNDRSKQESNTSIEISNNLFTKGNNDFTTKFLSVVSSLNAGKSVVMSAFSVLYLLTTLFLYTKPGESHDQLKKAINLQSGSQVRALFPVIRKIFENQKNVTFDLASKSYVNKKIILSQDFLYDTDTVLGAKAENIDVSKPVEAADTINDWVKSKTNNIIKDLVSPDMFDMSTLLVLVNAIYFKGNWTTPFNPQNTKDREFFKDEENSTKIPIMYLQSSFKYAQNTEHDFQIIEIPYDGGNFSLYVVLPGKNNGLELLLPKLSNSDILSSAVNSMENTKVNLYLPKFKISTSMDLKIILPQLVITKIFDKDSGIEGITENPYDLYVSSGIQKAVIEVNEKGSEAAAATALTVRLTSAVIKPPIRPVEFNSNRPFIYFLTVKKLLLFSGTFYGLNNN